MLEMWLKFSVGGLVAPPPLRGEVAATMEPNMILARDQVGGSNDPPLGGNCWSMDFGLRHGVAEKAPAPQGKMARVNGQKWGSGHPLSWPSKSRAKRASC